MASNPNLENSAASQDSIIGSGRASESSKDQMELGLRWVEDENPVRLFVVAETETKNEESLVPRVKAKNEKEALGKGRQGIFQVLRNDSAPTIIEKIEFRELDPKSEDLLWDKGIGNWLPDYKLPNSAVLYDEQAAKDYVESERDLYRKKLGGDQKKLAS